MTLYLDTSSLVKLYVAEVDTERVRRLVDDATWVATSQIAYRKPALRWRAGGVKVH